MIYITLSIMFNIVKPINTYKKFTEPSAIETEDPIIVATPLTDAALLSYLLRSSGFGYRLASTVLHPVITFLVTTEYINVSVM